MATKNSAENSSGPVEELNPDIDLSQEDAGLEDSSDFFEALDREVNGIILDESDTVDSTEQQETLQTDPEPVAVSDDHQHDYEKRYKDSSREARRLKEELDEMKQYEPLLNRLKEDTGMVDAIKQYVEGVEQPQNVQQALNLPEDFVLDLDDAITNPNSDSAKALEHTISSVVDRRVNSQLQQERQTREREVNAREQQANAESFKKNMNMTDSDFDDMMDWAKTHSTSLEDIYYLKNRSQRDQQVAKGAKEDMLKQMKSVREMPTSVANQNTVKADVSQEDRIFDALKNVDSGLDGLFG
tara:strand:+ start:4293 stop:5189 length:897 start_codon:yes stop_codon:yes gene_type:complete